MKLGLIKRMCTDFNNASTSRVLYYFLVRSKFEYTSLVWHTVSIFQNQFLMSIKNFFYYIYAINVVSREFFA